MVSTTPAIELRHAGRPRIFDDDDIFRATATVLANFGPSGLTLAAVAKELGCTAPALNKRFASKQGLITSFVNWATARSRERFDRMRKEHSSPIAALRARFTMPPTERNDEVADTVHYWNLQAFYASTARDPELLPLMKERAGMFLAEITSLLRNAQAAGEIVRCDPERLSRVLLAALTGVAYNVTTWEREATIEIRLGEMVDEITGPFRPEWNPTGG